MGKIAKGRAMLGLTVKQDTRDAIDERAKALNLSRSAFASLIVEHWKNSGMPPVTEPDRLMQIAKKAQKGM